MSLNTKSVSPMEVHKFETAKRLSGLLRRISRDINKRKLMWEIGVEGDKFAPHLKLDECSKLDIPCVEINESEIKEYIEFYEKEKHNFSRD